MRAGPPVGTAAPTSGRYALLLRLDRDLELGVGSLGPLSFPMGLYVYLGSAARALPARLARHARREKRVHWHVDRLTTCPACAVLGAVVVPGEGPSECDMARRCEGLGGARLLHVGFGSSDDGCSGHLVHLAGDATTLGSVVAALLDSWSSSIWVEPSGGDLWRPGSPEKETEVGDD